MASLTFNVHVDSEFALTADRGDESRLEHVGLRVTGGDAAIPWDQVLMARLEFD